MSAVEIAKALSALPRSHPLHAAMAAVHKVGPAEGVGAIAASSAALKDALRDVALPELASRPPASDFASGEKPLRLKRNSDPENEIFSAADLGRLIRAARQTQKLTQQEFADLAGVGRRFVSELESGKATLEFDRVLRVTLAAGISVFAQAR